MIKIQAREEVLEDRNVLSNSTVPRHSLYPTAMPYEGNDCNGEHAS